MWSIGIVTILASTILASDGHKQRGNKHYWHTSGLSRGVPRALRSVLRKTSLEDEERGERMKEYPGVLHNIELLPYRQVPVRLPSFHKSRRERGDIREKRGESEYWPIIDCMTVSSADEGGWEYRSDGRTQTCGLYLVGRPNQVVEITMEEVNVDCTEGLVVVFDGWELNGNVFPSPEDHILPMEKRSAELCDEVGPRKVFISNQNAALVSFNIPTPGEGFRLSVRYLENRDPCNILMSEMSGLFTLSNAGRQRNCSLTTLLFPASIKVMNLAVGEDLNTAAIDQGRHRRALPAGAATSCMEDFVQLGGSSELDSTHLSSSQSLCGREARRMKKGLTVLCGSSTVRLVSSGEYINTITVLVKAATEEDLRFEENMVITCPEYMEQMA